jgi:hypothetical protein
MLSQVTVKSASGFEPESRRDIVPTHVISEKLKDLALDLAQEPPRSPRETLAGYVLAPRILDKFRAELVGTLGEYWTNRYLDRLFFDFTGIDPQAFQAFVATGATDEEVAEWITQKAQPREKVEIVKWNNQLRYATLRDLPGEIQLFLDALIEKLPTHRPVYHVFDVFDLDEGRL